MPSGVDDSGMGFPHSSQWLVLAWRTASTDPYSTADVIVHCTIANRKSHMQLESIRFPLATHYHMDMDIQYK